MIRVLYSKPLLKNNLIHSLSLSAIDDKIETISADPTKPSREIAMALYKLVLQIWIPFRNL
jgi:hypothetical protein